MSLVDFWSQYPHPGIHPNDEPYVQEDDCVAWSSSIEANNHKQALEDKKGELQRKLHISLYPHPFVGNVRGASVYILFGNPGLSVQDYVDELETPAYAEHCHANLSGALKQFGPLLSAAKGTGAYRYWESTLKSLIRDVSSELGIPIDAARSWVLSQVATIEAGAYHSKRFPIGGFSGLPSTKAAKRFVDEFVMGRARNRECVVFVWRQASFWDLPKNVSSVKERDRRKANGRYLVKDERAFLVAKLAEVYRRTSGLRQPDPN